MKIFASALHSEELSACCHGIETQGRDRDGSTQLDHFFSVEEGTGEVVLDGVHRTISAGFTVLVPAGTNHNVINTGTFLMKK